MDAVAYAFWLEFAMLRRIICATRLGWSLLEVEITLQSAAQTPVVVLRMSWSSPRTQCVVKPVVIALIGGAMPGNNNVPKILCAFADTSDLYGLVQCY